MTTPVKPTVSATATVSKPQIEGEQLNIWNEIKDREIQMFAIPAQFVHNYCTPVPIDPSRCFLEVKASATLPAIEAALGPDFSCSSEGKYVVVARKQKALF